MITFEVLGENLCYFKPLMSQRIR